MRVKPELRRFGNEQNAVVVIDDFSGRVDEIVAIAEALAPFPDIDSGYYPGIRRMLEPTDSRAADYVQATATQVGPFIGGGFNFERYSLVEASFSIVTRKPGDLHPVQRAPHFDSPDDNYLAILHYLRVPMGTGTAFYRHRSTGVERVAKTNLGKFVVAAQADAAKLPPESGYISGSNDYYEQIGAVEAVPDRLVIYQGGLLHSGIIPTGMELTADPKRGRLTANLFVRGQ
jgi:hypothetical protein